MNEKMTIGWREWLSLPSLEIPAVKVKIDTGAKTSALHSFSTELYTENSITMVRFGLHPLQKNTDLEIVCTAPVKDQRIVTDSGGHSEMRCVIDVLALFRGVEWPIEVTLTNRDTMRFRMLLGRSAMAGKFIVDPELSYCGGRQLAKIYKMRKK